MLTRDERFRIIVEQGGIDFGESSGNSPLYEACQRLEVVRVVSLLEKSDTNVNAQNDRGETALHLAVF